MIGNWLAGNVSWAIRMRTDARSPGAANARLTSIVAVRRALIEMPRSRLPDGTAEPTPAVLSAAFGPAKSCLTLSTAGVLSNKAITLNQSGANSTITATKTGSSETGTSNTFTVNAGALAKFGMGMLHLRQTGTAAEAARSRRRYILAAGVALGLALLSKEVALLYLPALAVHALLFRRLKIVEGIMMGGTAAAVCRQEPGVAYSSESCRTRISPPRSPRVRRRTIEAGVADAVQSQPIRFLRIDREVQVEGLGAPRQIEQPRHQFAHPPPMA